MSLSIKTDHKWKNFKYGYEVPQSVLKSQFDYLDKDDVTDGFIFYRKTWYHLNDFMRFGYPNTETFKGFQAYLNDSYSSGVLIKISDDGEQYQIATFCS